MKDELKNKLAALEFNLRTILKDVENIREIDQNPINKKNTKKIIKRKQRNPLNKPIHNKTMEEPMYNERQLIIDTNRKVKDERRNKNHHKGRAKTVS